MGRDVSPDNNLNHTTLNGKPQMEYRTHISSEYERIEPRSNRIHETRTERNLRHDTEVLRQEIRDIQELLPTSVTKRIKKQK